VITAVDTDVFIDLFQDDPRHGRAAAEAMRQCIREGRLAVCDVVWAELASLFPTPRLLEEQMKTLEVEYLPLNHASASLAGEVWRKHHAHGRGRGRVLADFLVAAHAKVQCDRLLTRDRGFYREYFKGLTVFDPST